MNTALLLVDIQNDYFPGGKNELVESDAAAANAANVLAVFRQNFWPVYHVQHISLQPGATFFIPDTDGVKIHASVQPASGEELIIKHKPDSFLETDLQERLAMKKIKRLVIAGMMTHMCIDTTVRSARAKGYEVVLLHDACATRDLLWAGKTIPAATIHGAFMAALDRAFAAVVPSRELEVNTED